MFLLLAINTVEALKLVFFYLFIYVIILINFILVLILFKFSKIDNIVKFGILNFGVFSESILNSGLLLLSLFSLAGLPPFLGFFIKVYFYSLFINLNYYYFTIFIMILMLISYFYYIRLSNLFFFNLKSKFLKLYKFNFLNILIF